MMPEHDSFLLEKENVFLQGMFGLITLGSILMEPHGLTKQIHVNKPYQLQQ